LRPAAEQVGSAEHPGGTLGEDSRPQTAVFTGAPDPTVAARRRMHDTTGVAKNMARAIKLDTQLAGAVREAHEALIPLVPAGSVGEHLGATADADRLVTHRFEASVTGYRGWEWYVTLGRASRSKVVTVCESGLLPGPDALLAPDWVPWSQRMSADELASVQDGAEQATTQTHDDAAESPQAQGAEGAERPEAGTGEPNEDGADEEQADAAVDAGAEADAQDEPDEAETEDPEARAPRRRRRRRRS
jgi:hypothetical protein